MIFLDPRNDIAFKKIFGSDEHKNITISFLNSVLELTGEQAIESINFLNNEQIPQRTGKKENILDIACVDQAGNSYIIELQIASERNFDKRIVFYSAKSYSIQLEKGEDYRKLMPVIAVSVLDFVLFDKKKNYRSIHRILDEETYENDLRELAFAFIELPKFNKKEHELVTAADKWIYFIKEIRKQTKIPSALAHDEFEEACQAINRLTWPSHELDIYEKEAIKASVYHSTLETKYEEGREEGREEKQTEIARNLLKCDIRLEIIAESTGLSLEEIKKLKQC